MGKPQRFNRWTKPAVTWPPLSRFQLRQNAVAAARATLRQNVTETGFEFAIRSLSEVFAAQNYVAAAPASSADVSAAEQRLGVMFPAELRALALFADGSGDGVGGSGCDLDGVRFWPLREWVLDENRQTRIVFADYREESWWYSAASLGDKEPGAVSIAGYISEISPTLYASVADFVTACAFDRLFDPLPSLHAQFGNV